MVLIVIVAIISIFLVWNSNQKKKSVNRGRENKQIQSKGAAPKPPQQRSPKLDGIITDAKKNDSAATRDPSVVGKQPKFGDDFHAYTLPFERHKSLNLLRGMIAGATCDGEITDKELTEIVGWCNVQASLYDLDSFFQLHSLERRLIDTGRINESEKAVLIAGYMHPSTVRKCVDEKTSELQFLTGLCYGMISDAELTDFEVQSLGGWLSVNENLSGTFLYDNLSGLVSKALGSSPMREKDRVALYSFLGDLVDFRYSTNLNALDFDNVKHEHGIRDFVEKDVIIELSQHIVCLTGQSSRVSKGELLLTLERYGAIYRERVSSKTDYLICLDVPDPAWAFPRYGRKFERGIDLIQSGAKLRIVSESVLWNAITNA